jgi:hypothetical protein
MRRLAPLAGIAIAIELAVAACGSTGPTPTPTPVTSSAAASVAPTSAPTSVPSSAPGSSPAAGGAVEDPSLLAVLPANVEGIDVTLEHQAFLDAITDPGFAKNVKRAAFGVAVSGTDLVSGVVAQLAPDAYSDAFFRDWRDTYNQGACGQAGGVVGNAEAQIGGRTVYIASCAGDLRVYHTWLPERGAIVSAFALGQKRLGEALMAGLRP